MLIFENFTIQDGGDVLIFNVYVTHLVEYAAKIII